MIMQQAPSSSSSSPSLSPPPPPPPQPPRGTHGAPEMDLHSPVVEVDPTTWDWNDLLDFAVDDTDQFPVSFESGDLTPAPQQQLTPPPAAPPVEEERNGQSLDRVRKRDPRLTCSNFLAGRIPCACPEMDEKLEEEEAGMPWKKRARTSRSRAGTVRCQVPGCEADISELKGYHKRHRVCLRCANASCVSIDGETKRYCQQCGKFHLLSDFDEGKRSCRRKLERHNNRRRRKPVDSKSAIEQEETQGILQTEDNACDSEGGKDCSYVNCQMAEQEAQFESEDGYVPNVPPAPAFQNINCDSVVSFLEIQDTEMEGGKDDSKFSLSPSFCDKKSAYSSVCPTGRISFKLYDWNPAEFPRRLRHQIFQWLSNMPVELEAYIRPGCTILTVFIAMPENMWMKLSKNPLPHLHEFVFTPGRMLYKRGSMTIYINDMVFCIRKDEISLTEINVVERAPKLHYVYPACFEAGKPMEFVACGSNLLQPKLRFLVSFAGRYLAYNYCVASSHVHAKGESSHRDHQLYNINVPHTEPDLFGPAFIEVDNQAGLSNFVPVLIGDEEVCSEMKLMQQRFDSSLAWQGPNSETTKSLCDLSIMRQQAFSELVLDLGWLLKEPTSENLQEFMSYSNIQRYSRLLNFLINNESTIILKKIVQKLEIMMDKSWCSSEGNGSNRVDMVSLKKSMHYARQILDQKIQKGEISVLPLECSNPVGDCCSKSISENDSLLTAPLTSKDLEARIMGGSGVMTGSSTINRSETAPLLSTEVIMNVNLSKEWPSSSCSPVFSSKVLRSRPAVFLIATAALCFGICAIFFHPRKLEEFAVTIRRSLFDRS